MLTRGFPSLLCPLLLLTAVSIAADRPKPRAYVFFNLERQRIAEKSFLENPRLEGAQLKYTWKQLEGEPGEYRFDDIRHDLEFLTAHGKRLFIQLQDVSFDPNHKPFPKYLLTEEQVHGGANVQYDFPGDDESKAKPAGWVARRWDPAVSARWAKLVQALGKEFDGKIEGINLPETAIEFGQSGKLFPAGFTPEVYRDAVIANMKTLKQAFPRSVAMQYANFMTEAKGADDPANLKAVYRAAVELNIAVGGPDLLPGKYWQMHNSYPLIREVRGKIPSGIAVQEGNYAFSDPKTRQRRTIPELLDFAQNYLGVTYIFWCTEEPYYSRDVLPFYQP